MFQKNQTFYQLYQNDSNVIQGPIYLAYVLLATEEHLQLPTRFFVSDYIYRMIVGNYFITVQSCLFYQSVPIVGHSNLNLVAYASFICSICSFYVAFNFYMIIKYIHKTEDTLVLCLVPEPLSFRKENNLIFQLTSVSINVTAILIYVVVWTGLHCQKHVSEVTKRAFKALTAIIVALLIGWVAGPTSQLILIRLEAEPMQMFYSIAISGVCINILKKFDCLRFQ
ncbi:hypothetical protein M3Y96_01011600 [Aphelenchoides besseyi]|nr:hypothetical protein M3Y96_01011600 [Aphelenchoides besseyi]